MGIWGWGYGLHSSPSLAPDARPGYSAAQRHVT